jgi:hypothetical protein
VSDDGGLSLTYGADGGTPRSHSQITETKQIFLTEPNRFVLAFCTPVHSVTSFSVRNATTRESEAHNDSQRVTERFWGVSASGVAASLVGLTSRLLRTPAAQRIEVGRPGPRAKPG